MINQIINQMIVRESRCSRWAKLNKENIIKVKYIDSINWLMLIEWIKLVNN